MFRIDRRLVNLTAEEMPAAAAPSEPAAQETPPSSDGSPLPAAAEPETAPPTTSTLEAVAQLSEEMLAQTESEAAVILAAAREQAAQLLQQAEAEAAAVEQAAHERGYSEGWAAAEQSRLDARAEDSAMLERLLALIEQARLDMFDQMERDLIDLTLATVKKIIHLAHQEDETVFESMIIKALRQIKWEGKIVIRVNPAEFQRFFPNGSATFVLGNDTITATVVEDSQQPPMGLIVESDGATINAGVDSQLHYITLAFSHSAEPEA